MSPVNVLAREPSYTYFVDATEASLTGGGERQGKVIWQRIGAFGGLAQGEIGDIYVGRISVRREDLWHAV